MENGKKSRDSQMVGDYGVEEWRDGGKLPIPTDKYEHDQVAIRIFVSFETRMTHFLSDYLKTIIIFLHIKKTIYRNYLLYWNWRNSEKNVYLMIIRNYLFEFCSWQIFRI